MSLNNKAMIVTLNVSCWTARKQDKKVSAEVDSAHNAQNAGRYNKLLIDKGYLDPLSSFANKVRQYHYKMTLPWMDNGGRLLPSKLFMEYRNEMDSLRSQYEQLVRTFIKAYDGHLVQDARMRLGTLYEPEDYPPGSDLWSKFSIDLDIMPVPDAADFRVDVAESEISRIREEIATNVAQRQRKAMDDAWARVRDVVQTIELRLSAPKPVIRDSLIDNAKELTTLLPSLNVIDDPVMAEVAHEITHNLLVDVWTLRNSLTARNKVAQAAKKILEKIPA